ncbi:adenosine 3'-phospho 5'-phosphosulfate transporter 2 isoform X1 [Hydra vulgaris]|nr:adenosine 3'-phospho 5'-phosphosulfate transporter 2 [Hydra vulgaris]
MIISSVYNPKIEAHIDKKLLLFNFDISKLSISFQFLLCVGGVFLCYLPYGYFQEFLFSIPLFKPYGWYLTLVQFAIYAILAFLQSTFLEEEKQRRIPLKIYCILALLAIGTIGMSNKSLGYVNYPTQVIFKCCKLIPVMLGGIVIQGKRYNLLDFTTCILMSIGLSLFVLADSTVSPEFSYIGVLCLSIALCADAVVGNLQEKTMKEFNASNTEVVLYSYGIGFFFLFMILLFVDSLYDSFIFFNKDPFTTYGYSLMFSISGYFGVTFVLTLVRVFGALLAVSVTTFRKAVTIILSFVMFAKPFTLQYVWSGLIVLLAIALNMYQKNKQKIDLQIDTIVHQINLRFCKKHKHIPISV